MNKTVIFIIVIAIIVLAGYLLFGESSQPSSTPLTPSKQQVTESPATQTPITQVTPQTQQYIVTYTDSGYSPSVLRIKVGTTVSFKNMSSQGMWTASAVHPSHIVYSGTSIDSHCPDTKGIAFDACVGIQPGNSWSFTFTKVGTWKYHNHLTPGDIGTIVVER